jgi:hypothetical protein
MKLRCDALVGASTAPAAMDSSRAALMLLRRNVERTSDLDDPIFQIQYQTELGRRLLNAEPRTWADSYRDSGASRTSRSCVPG